ncbi:MAG TPA: hypothetical protein VGO96_02145 [Pyrinomonadaceae bacterium]|jgi:hypothetical protein|nr:hypothetical protein [Pyrinomonadaceae bacterium]
MNADFETELAAAAGGDAYRRTQAFAALNQRLAPHLLWLASPGDALLLESPWPETLTHEAARRRVELLLLDGNTTPQPDRIFTPWGWTASVVRLGESLGAQLSFPPLETVRRVNSKLWSHALEQELGLDMPGACAASDFDALQEAVARACPRADDKWVIKSPFGFAARERVLGRGAQLEGAQATWARRQFAKGTTLIFQPWLERVREYGVTMEIRGGGEVELKGISDLQTNGAGTGTGYLLGRTLDAARTSELESLAQIVGARLFKEGYAGAAGLDAIEHTKGLHPLLEINARYTMGFVALAIERALNPPTPTLWKLNG